LSSEDDISSSENEAEVKPPAAKDEDAPAKTEEEKAEDAAALIAKMERRK